MEQEAIDFRQLGEDSSELIVACDAQFRYTYVNPAAERLLGIPREQLRGRTLRELDPPTQDPVYATHCCQAMQQRTVVEFEAFDPAREQWHRVRCVPTADGGLILFKRDISEERKTGRAREEALSLLQAVIDGTTDMVAAIDRDRRFLLANTATARFLGFDSPGDLIGKTDYELLPGEANHAMLRRVQAMDDAVLESGIARAFEFVTENTPTGTGPRVYLSNKAPLRAPETGEIVGLVNIIHDFSDRARAEKRLRRLFDSRVVGVIFWNLDTGLITDANDTFLALVGYTREDLAAGRLDFRRMTPPEWTERNEQGVETIRREGAASAYEKEYFRKDGSRVPILIGGTRFEESGAEGFSYILDITERKRWEREQARLFADTRAQAEREAFINQIGDGIRLALAPDEIEGNAIAALGTALAADRCYVFTADTEHDSLVISRDWHVASIPSIAGQYRLSELGIDVDAVFGSGATLVVPHLQGAERLSEQNAAANRGFAVTSLINVPFYEGGRFVGALGVAMAHTPRQWSAEEVTLAETVAGQLRSVLEAARLQQRDRNIARQLQAALLPDLPETVPGMVLRSFYRPALEEAGVGGDFADIFPAKGGTLTSLVVSDLSGKGLAAASQVAAVKNMLRFALHSDNSLGASVTRLNQVLVEQELITGFATLFVGMFDAAAGTLCYVNAGQEPGLIWRAATGRVEQLPPTGPVLGGFIEGIFTESRVALAPGDILGLFTDGMTEVGPNRKWLLEIDGLTTLFARCCAESTAGPARPAAEIAATVVNGLITGVERHAGGAAGIRDDITLLVGVATD